MCDICVSAGRQQWVCSVRDEDGVDPMWLEGIGLRVNDLLTAGHSSYTVVAMRPCIPTHQLCNYAEAMNPKI